MRPIQQADCPKVSREFLVMQVMGLGRPSQEIVSAVYTRRLQQLDRQKHPEGEYVAAKDLGRENYWRHVGNHVFDWMRVLRSQCEGSCKLVVKLVYARIENAVM